MSCEFQKKQGKKQINRLKIQCVDVAGVGLGSNVEVENQCLRANADKFNETKLMSTCLRVSPTLNQNQALFSDSKSHRDQISTAEIEEEYFQIRQGKRRKKALNKKTRSIREI
ncbi:hypothetical protein PVK06_022094 [Gossypium arboreum]|uniref:Uncharacterized protein n=1 Tax=Gossypium arboreum TaxID=29729 RepID=A0ABR0P7H5_GOSAR|nr:hypothetical protein PVK06_022094 [Gossypium arboreum]